MGNPLDTKMLKLVDGNLAKIEIIIFKMSTAIPQNEYRNIKLL